MAWGNILLDMLVNKPKAQRAIDPLIASLGKPQEDGTIDYGSNQAIVERVKAMRETHPMKAHQFLLKASTPEAMQQRELNQIQVDEAKHKQGLIDELRGLIRGGASVSDKGQKRINDTLLQLVPSSYANNRKTPHGAPFLGPDGNMHMPVWDPLTQTGGTQNLGAADPKYTTSDVGGGLNLVTTSGPSAGSTRAVMTAEQAGEGQGVAAVNQAEQNRRYEDRMALYDSSANRTLRHIDEALSHENFDDAYGMNNIYPDALVLPGTGRKNFLSYLEQAEGGAFMEGYQMLKGGGSVTEVETRKAEQALARISNRSQSDEEARKAWKDYAEAIEEGLKKLENRTTVDFASSINRGTTGYDEFAKQAKVVRGKP